MFLDLQDGLGVRRPSAASLGHDAEHDTQGVVDAIGSEGVKGRC